MQERYADRITGVDIIAFFIFFGCRVQIPAVFARRYLTPVNRFFGSDSNREVTKRLLETIRKCSPNMGKYDFLLELPMDLFEHYDRDCCE